MGESQFSPEFNITDNKTNLLDESGAQDEIPDKRRYLEKIISDRILKWQAVGYDLKAIRNILPHDFQGAIIESTDSRGRHSASFNMDALLNLIESSSSNFFFPEPKQIHKNVGFVTLPPVPAQKVEDKGLGNEIERGRRELKLLRVTDLLKREGFDFIHLSGLVSKDQWRELPYDGLYLEDQKVLITVCDEMENITFVIHNVETEEEATEWLAKTKPEIKAAGNGNDVHFVMYSKYPAQYEDRILMAIKGVRARVREKVKTGKSLEERAAEHGLKLIEGHPGLYVDVNSEDDTLWASSGYFEKAGIPDPKLDALKRRFSKLPKEEVFKLGPQLKDAPDIQLMNYRLFKNEYDKTMQYPELNNNGAIEIENKEQYAIDLYFVKQFKGTDDAVVRRGLTAYKTLHAQKDPKFAREESSLMTRQIYDIEEVNAFLVNYGCRTEREDLPVLDSSYVVEVDGKKYITKQGIHKKYRVTNKVKEFMRVLEESEKSNIPTIRAYAKEGQLIVYKAFELEKVEAILAKLGVRTKEGLKNYEELDENDEVVINGIRYITLIKLEKLTAVDQGNLKNRFKRHNLLMAQAKKDYTISRPDGANFTTPKIVNVVERDKALELYPNVRLGANRL